MKIAIISLSFSLIAIISLNFSCYNASPALINLATIKSTSISVGPGGERSQGWGYGLEGARSRG